MRTIILLLLSMVPLQAKVNLSGVAAGTTVAVNAGTMARWVRHPKREAKKTAKSVKDVVKGKN